MIKIHVRRAWIFFFLFIKNIMDYIRTQLGQHILGGNAFKKLEDILEEFPFEQLGKQIEGLPYTFWQQFEHMRITQKDILDFSTNENYKELKWPADYWTKDFAPTDREEWEQNKKRFFRDRDMLLSLIQDAGAELSAPFDHGGGQTLFREGLLVLEHNAYHTGQLAILSRLIIGNQKTTDT